MANAFFGTGVALAGNTTLAGAPTDPGSPGAAYAALNTAVNARFPTGLSVVDDRITQGNYDLSSGLWSIGTFPPGTTAKLTAHFTVNPGPARTVSFTASTVGSDTNSANNSATALLRVLGTATFKLARHRGRLGARVLRDQQSGWLDQQHGHHLPPRRRCHQEAVPQHPVVRYLRADGYGRHH